MNRIFWWLILLPASLLLAGYWFLWLQYYLPNEDGPIFPSLQGHAAAGLMLGVGLAASRSARRRVVLFGASAPLMVTTTCCVVLYILEFKFLAVVVFPVALCFCVPWAIGVRLARRGGSNWQLPLAGSLVPPVLVSTLGCPYVSGLKWMWPWISYRPALVALRDDSLRVAERLGLPSDRRLTPEESVRWFAAKPVDLSP